MAEEELFSTIGSSSGSVKVLRGGRSGPVWMTHDLYVDRIEATDRLSLPITPEIGVAFLVNRGDIIEQGIVGPVPASFWQETQPPFDTSGGGYQSQLRQGAQAIPVTVWGLL
jgi:hypothetical protein